MNEKVVFTENEVIERVWELPTKQGGRLIKASTNSYAEVIIQVDTVKINIKAVHSAEVDVDAPGIHLYTYKKPK